MKSPKHEIPAVLLILLLTMATVPAIGTQINLIQAGSSGASLTGSLSSDGGVDSDGDGLLDFLKIDVQVNVTGAGTYRVSVSGLYDSNSGYIPVSGENSTYLDVGPQAIAVSLYGSTIYMSALNPVRVDSIYLYDISGGNWTWLGSISSIPLSREYLYIEFEPPPATLTGTIFDSGVDTDSDSLSNYLQVSVQINVTQPGSYYITISDLEDNNNSISFYASTNEYLDVGARLVNFSLDGRKIQGSGINPSYVRNIYLNFYGNYSYSDSLYHVPLSRTYLCTSFDPPEAFLTGKIYDKGLDTDGDDKFNYLQVSVEINTTQYGEYRVEISGLLAAPANSSSNYINVYGSTSGYFDVGIHVLNASLDGVLIYASDLAPMRVSLITLYMPGYSASLSGAPLSQEYRHNDFDPPGASLTGEVVDHGVDTDLDGKFNYLQVEVEVNVTDAGYYTVGVSRLNGEGYSSIYVYDSEYLYLSDGIQVVYLQLDGLTIRLSGINPINIDYISLSDASNRNIDSLNRVPLDSAYSYTDFQPPPATLTGSISDEGVDTDGDGQFNYFVVGVEVNVTQAGQYITQISGLLDASYNSIDVWGTQHIYLDVGVHLVNVSLDGLRINRLGLNPQYADAISLRDQNYNTLDISDNVPLSRQYFYYEFETPGAVLTGKIFDQGVDTDADGKYDYLQIGVEVNVAEPGYYSVSVSDLVDSSYNHINIYASNYTFLGAGLRIVYLYLEGPIIYLSGLNPRFVGYISLNDEKSSFYDSRSMISLAREYSYMEFDPPAAVLTGKIYDRGVDSDGDGAFNYLEVAVEINVTKAADVSLNIDGLRDAYGNWIRGYGSAGKHLDVGTHVLNVSLPGLDIYQSHLNPRYVNQISLYADYYTSLEHVTLSKEYQYTWFDFPATLTGVIFDEGVDTDADGYFEYLEVDVQVNVSDPGAYVLSISGLLDSNSYYISVYDYKTTYLDKGLQTVDLYLYGPQIYISHLNPSNVSYISLNMPQGSFYYCYDFLNNAPLSREYSYTEFDAPLMDVEAKLAVYPDGRVAAESTIKYTNMIPQNWPRYTGLEGTFNITGGDSSAQSSAAMSLTLPPDYAAQFPFNSSTFKMLADYSNGIFDFRVNASSILPSVVDSIYSYNPTEGTITATYSGGVLSIQAQGDATLPSEDTQQFPLNATDVTIIGDYSSNTLTGNITFSVLDGFTFDDVKLDFTGNQTHLKVNGTVQVVFNVPFNGLIIHNMTELTQIIDELKSKVPGEGGMVWNMTDGLLNVTNLNIDCVPNSLGANVNFSIDIHGDFVHALAYILSGGRSEMLLSPVLDEARDCVREGSFNINYSCSARKASVELTFSYDLKHLVDYICTIPEGNMAFAVASNGMYPTLQIGDLIYVEPVSDASSIVADPQSGDIIVFHSPSDPSIVFHSQSDPSTFVAHRAANKTLVNGTVYFQTKGDYNSYPDYWSGNDTWNGMVSSRLLVGKVYRRVPIVGALFLYLSSPYSTYWDYCGTVTPLWLLKDTVSSVQEASLQLSYNSTSRKLDFSLASVHELKALYENITQKLPQSLPPEIPAEIGEVIESLLNTTYASVGSAHVELSYANGQMDFEADAAIEGNLNTQLNHVKDAYFRLMGVYYSQVNMTLPWQLGFLNQTGVDVNNFKLSAKLYENTFEGKIEGLTLLPPMDAFNGTSFTLTRLLNLTNPYPYEPEFPGQNQMLGMTIEGGSNATHGVTLFRNPASVSQPDTTNIHQMVWHNSTLSSLQNMVFVIHELNQFDLGWIVGQVINASSQMPVAGVPVTVNGAFATTDSQGYYIFSNIASGDYEVIVTAPGYVTATEQVHHNPGVTTTANFELLTEGTVEGTVKDASTSLPISGAHITLNEYATTTDADGHYELSVPIGDHTITAEAADYLSDSKPVHVDPHATTTVDFALMPAGTLTVTTSPVSGVVFVNGTSWGAAPQSRRLKVGTYNVTFGSVVGYKTPAWQLAVVQKGVETSIDGAYQPITGTLSVNTTPVFGEVFVKGISWGISPQSRTVLIGTYSVSFGDVIGYYTPTSKQATVREDEETIIEGVYQKIPVYNGTLSISTTPVSAEVFVNGTSWGKTPQSRTVKVGTYTITFGEAFGYSTPPLRVVEVHRDTEISVEGVYTVAPNSVVAEITNPALVNATHPFIVDAAQVAGITLSISEISAPVTIVVKNVTAPVGVDPLPGTWKALGNYVQITVNDIDVSVQATMRIYYTHEQLEALGLDESSLKIYCWDAATGEWVAVESHVNTAEHVVWANIDHFSYWALMGQSAVGDTWNQLIVGIAVAIIVIIAVAVVLKKRKQPAPKQESAQS